MGKVNFVVQIGAFGELARRGNAQTLRPASLKATRQQQPQHHSTAMGLQLQHVFTRVAMGRGKIQRQTLVYGRGLLRELDAMRCCASGISCCGLASLAKIRQRIPAEGICCICAKRQIGCLPGHKLLAAHRSHHRSHRLARYPHDAHRTAPRRGGNGGNRFGVAL